MPPRQLDKVYEPQSVEARWGEYWIDQKLFSPSPDDPGEPYTIVIPPPNVTGSLHIGHALNNTLQDILIRWRRMQGYNALWLPGTDHAGIATQNVVERQLHQEGTTREAVGREAFIERVWRWRTESGDTIIGQLKRLGASCDWSRMRFTMDEGLSRAVRQVFVSLYAEGLLYRGKRLINWCPRCLTALSDIEVEHDPIKGHLYHLRYPVDDSSGTILTIATTRPETLLGDTAVAVHPEDVRYHHLIGQRIRLPLTNRSIPIVGDGILVDREFGTGAVKITPAHDFNDFEAGERHGLPQISILNFNAALDPQGLQQAGVDPPLLHKLGGLPVAKARSIVIEELESRGVLETIEDHQMSVGKCYRCKTVVEPYLSPQWFVKVQPLADPAIAAVTEGRIRIIPEGWTNNYLGWMREIKDWCVSRQIWWGHRIPAWYCLTCHPEVQQAAQAGGSGLIPVELQPVVGLSAPTTCTSCGGTTFFQDPDVLDTWFSSALWPFSTMGWPERTKDLGTFFPTATLVTGLDILFFWVARMIMMGLKVTGSIPFRDVYIHALVRDAEGQKMSKSKGNVIDPLTKMSQYGTDALRFTLASMASPGRDIKLAEERIEGYRNFTNKIWNAARFLLLYAEGPRTTLPLPSRSFPDQWILSRLHSTIVSVTTHLEEYRFDLAANTLYHCIWHEFCDWYLEMIKPTLQASSSPHASSTRHSMLEAFEHLLRALHPFMPFLTEEIWQSLPHEGETIVCAPYPTGNPAWASPSADCDFSLVEQFVTMIRTGRSLLEYAPSKQLTLFGSAMDEEDMRHLQRLLPHIEHLGRGTLTLSDQETWPNTHVLRLVVGGMTVGLTIEGDIDLRKSLQRIKKQSEGKRKEATRLEGRLASTDFTAKASSEVIQESQARLQSLTLELSLLSSSEEQIQHLL